MQLETCVPSYMVDVTIDESELPLLHQIMSQKCMKQYHIGIYYSPHIHLPSSKMCFSIFDRFRDVAKWQYSQIRMFFVTRIVVPWDVLIKAQAMASFSPCPQSTSSFFILPEIDCDSQCNRGEYPTKISFWQMSSSLGYMCVLWGWRKGMDNILTSINPRTTSWDTPCSIFLSLGFNLRSFLLHSSSCIYVSHVDICSYTLFI